MKRILTLLFAFVFLSLKAEVSIISWNLCELGGSKSSEELTVIASIVNSFDLVIIQEVVANDPKGAQSVAILTDLLNRMGAKWDYAISDPTKSPSPYISERYAFLWKPSRIKVISKPRLLDELSFAIFREPYYAVFHDGEKSLHVLNFHSRRYDQNPEVEVEALIDYVVERHDSIWIIAGDFNMKEDHSSFKNLYKYNYKPILYNQPTTLKMVCDNGRYLNHAIDNIYISCVLACSKSGIVDFVGSCAYLSDSRKISDHLPVYAIVE